MSDSGGSAMRWQPASIESNVVRCLAPETKLFVWWGQYIPAVTQQGPLGPHQVGHEEEGGLWGGGADDGHNGACSSMEGSNEGASC